jgi:hypothetical protein
VETIDMLLEAAATVGQRLADNFQPLGKPNTQCQASFLSVPDFLLSLLDAGDARRGRSSHPALLLSFAI